ncbi:hypothetical protein EJ110_NYTH05678 [Nymphaea thermarum]|nr:hypothetical protein EJ110_NYTH05678 [Nymphaea thermarum]
MEEFKRKHNEDINNNHRSLRALRMQCEKAKCHLSSMVKGSLQKRNGITINNVCNLSARQIKKMVKDSERYKLEDEKYRKKLHMYNYQIRNVIRNERIRANISYSEGKKIEDAI